MGSQGFKPELSFNFRVEMMKATPGLALGALYRATQDVGFPLSSTMRHWRSGSEGRVPHHRPAICAVL